MNAAEFAAARKSVTTAWGEIAYVERGSGPVALFVHGVLLNGYMWRDSLEALSTTRRCIALDLMGHGATKITPGQPVAFVDQAAMIAGFLDALGIDAVDLVANDSGGGIAQVFAAAHPERLRSLTLTNCDTHDNYPPPALVPFIKIIEAGGFAELGKRALDDLGFARQLLGTGYEHPELVTDETIRTYLMPLFASDEAADAVARFLLSQDNAVSVAIEPMLRQLKVPTMIVWGTDDIFFDKKWAYWLKDTIPGATHVIEAPGGKLFFPEERAEWFSDQVGAFWATTPTFATATSNA